MSRITRGFTTSFAVLALALAGVVAPTVTLPLPEARAVQPDVDSVQLRGVDRAALGQPGALARAVGAHAHGKPDDAPSAARGAEPGAGARTGHDEAPEGRLAALTPRTATQDFLVAGVSWDAGSDVTVTEVAVRLRERGRWGAWQAMGVDGVEMAGGRAGTEPLVSPGADGAQARVRTVEGTLPPGLRLDVIDPGTSPADRYVGVENRPAASADAGSGTEIRPGIVSRKGWGADESRGGSWNTVSGRLDAIYVHHTAGTNSYSRSQSPAIVRGIYAYHTGSRDWPDIGYQFLVDKYGRIFQGRRAAQNDNPIGAQAGGFNTGTIGVAALGNFETARPTSAVQTGIARVVAWKAYQYHVAPKSYVSLYNGGSQGSGTRSAPGSTVRVPTILGHRNTNFTSCPGRYMTSRLPALRTAVKQRVDAARARYGPARFTTRAPAVVTASAEQRPVQWSGSATYRWRPVAGAARYQVLERSADFDERLQRAPYWRVHSYTTGTSVTIAPERGTTKLLAVRAIDSKSRRGPAQTLVLTSRPVNPADWVRSSGWSRVSSSTYYGDGAYRTSSSRAEIRIPGARDVRSVRVKAPTGPGYGRVQVLVNGVAYGSFSLSAAASAQRTFAVSLPSPRSGTVTLRTLDSGREVRISGIGLGR